MKKYLLLFYLSLFILFPKTQFAQWSTVYDDGKYYIMGIDFKDENTGFAGGYNLESDSVVIIRTVDAGNNWEEVYKLPDGYKSPYCFTFIGDSLIISGGQDGSLFKSTDGGSTWEYYASLPWNNDIYDIYFFNDQIGFAGLYRTTNGGYNWENMEIGNTNDFYPINDSTVFTAAGGLFYSNDYGANWLKVNLGPPHTYSSVSMATDLVGYAVKYPSMINKTIDGGMTWFEIDSLRFDEIKQIRFIDENTGYILVNNYSMRVMRTQDGGNTWDYVLFGNDYSHQMALADESTILVPTINGIMYKTTNGGGDPILPRYTEIDWYSKLRYGWADPIPPLLCLNSYSQPYLMDMFKDTLFVDEVPILISYNPQYRNTFILRYNTWGSLDWYTMVEDSDNNISVSSCAIDDNNNYYLIYKKGQSWSTGYTTNLVKYSSEGDSLWTKTFTTDSTLHNIVMKTTAANHIIISGEFSGTLGYDNNNIHSDNWGVFILELDQDGNFLNLNRIVEAFFSFDNIHFDINDEESICLSFSTPGPVSFNPVYINSDTLDPSYYYLFFLDQDLNLLWYNTNFDSTGKNISNVLFNLNSKILLRGQDMINNYYYQVVYQYDDQGFKTDSTYIRTGPGNGVLCKSTNNRILTTGNYSDLSILENDTLYGFGRYGNSSIYTLSNDLEFVKSSHISGTGISSLLENQHNSYLVGSINTNMENIIFTNDTIIADGNDYFIAKLNSIITPVSEKTSHNKLRVFPNPSSGMFSVVLPEGSSKNGLMEVYSIAGQKVYEIWVSEHNNTLDLSKLNKGIYFVQLSIDRRIYTEKIIVQ